MRLFLWLQVDDLDINACLVALEANHGDVCHVNPPMLRALRLVEAHMFAGSDSSHKRTMLVTRCQPLLPDTTKHAVRLRRFTAKPDRSSLVPNAIVWMVIFPQATPPAKPHSVRSTAAASGAGRSSASAPPVSSPVVVQAMQATDRVQAHAWFFGACLRASMLDAPLHTGLPLADHIGAWLVRRACALPHTTLPSIAA